VNPYTGVLYYNKISPKVTDNIRQHPYQLFLIDYAYPSSQTILSTLSERSSPSTVHVLQLNNTRVAVIVYMCIQFHRFLNWFESRTLLKPRTYRLEYG